MKKIYKMRFEDNYIISDTQTNDDIMVIDKKTLNVEGKQIFEIFFDKFVIGDSIEIIADKTITDSNDKLKKAVYENVNEIIETISKNISQKKEDLVN